MADNIPVSKIQLKTKTTENYYLWILSVNYGTIAIGRADYTFTPHSWTACGQITLNSTTIKIVERENAPLSNLTYCYTFDNNPPPNSYRGSSQIKFPTGEAGDESSFTPNYEAYYGGNSLALGEPLFDNNTNSLILGKGSNASPILFYNKHQMQSAIDASKYIHPAYLGSTKTSGLYKIAINSQGHISSVASVEKADIIALGIPGEANTYDNATKTEAGLMSAADKTKLDSLENYTLPSDLSVNTLVVNSALTDIGANKYGIRCAGSVKAKAFYSDSDKRLKENIQPFTPKKSILDLPIYKFDYINGDKNQIGCLAQDLQEICPDIVSKDIDDYLSINESKIIYLLLDELKTIKSQLTDLEEKYNVLL